MSIFHVRIIETFVDIFEVEAETLDEAISFANAEYVAAGGLGKNLVSAGVDYDPVCPFCGSSFINRNTLKCMNCGNRITKEE